MESRKSRCLTLMVFAGIMCLSFFFTAACSKSPPQHEIVKSSGNKIILPLEKVNDGKAHFFTYKKSGKRINFFIRTDGNGNLISHFDACYLCNKHKKGYRVEETDLVCNECEMRFGLADETWKDTNCSPIVFRNQQENNNIIIETSVLERGAKLF
jgi:uncharacterized membrane protein